jgi:hypothetical protein
MSAQLKVHQAANRRRLGGEALVVWLSPTTYGEGISKSLTAERARGL